MEIVDAGLTIGKGRPEPGKMCVEAAVCFAFGLPHGDNPPCVGEAVRSFKIALNDCRWSSDEARANGMRKLAIAQLGSDKIDQMAFGKAVYFKGVQRLLPFVFRQVAQDVVEKYKAKYLEHANLCAVTNFEDAERTAKDASSYAAYAYATYASAASAYAYAASATTTAFASSAYASKKLGDKFLLMVAEIGLEVLKEMRSPGCKWLSICDE